MQALAWWAIPLIATAVAIAWAVFAAKPKGPDDALDTVEAHRAFREALNAPAPTPVVDPSADSAAANDSTEWPAGGSVESRGDRPAA